MKKFFLIFVFMVFFTKIMLSQTTDEKNLCLQTFAAGYEAGELGTEAVSTAAEAVWGASGLNSGYATFVGTLTQSASNSDYWTYSATPSDKLVIIYANGPTIELKFSTFNGYVDGTWENFCDSHILDFTVKIAGQIDLRIQSQCNVGEHIEWQRTITGTVLYEGENYTIDITHTGSKSSSVSSGIAFYDYQEQYSGTANSSSKVITISESSVTHLGHNSNLGQHVKEVKLWNNSSTTFGGTTYQFQNVGVIWVGGSILGSPGTFNKVIEGEKWAVQGTVLKSGQLFGTVQFDGPVNNDTQGPRLVLRLNNGTDILLHQLLNLPTSFVKIESEKPLSFKLGQNYPNPFNPTTSIPYSISKKAEVTIRIFNHLGQEIKTLVKKIHQPGFYQVNWNGTDFMGTHCGSGIYYYQIISKDHSEVNRMVLIR